MTDHHGSRVCLDLADQTDICLTITVGHRADGSLSTAVHFPTGEKVEATAADPDLGLDEPDNVLHDVAHTLLACLRGLERSPVLERVVDLRPLSQRDVDLEELAAFAFQAWCIALSGRDPGPALVNAAAALARLHPGTKEHVVCPECHGAWGASSCTHCSPERAA